MKTLILIVMIPVLALAWELPPGLELVSVDGDHVTVKDTRSGISDTYLIEGEPVINGWAVEPTEDSLIFELVADLHMLLTEDLQAYDFLNDGYLELIGCNLILIGEPLVFLENDGDFNFSEVNRIDSGNILYDIGDADNDGLIELLTQWDRSFFIYEQNVINSYADSLVWQIMPLEGPYRVWPRYSDLDDDGLTEISFQNSLGFRKIVVYENTGNNEYNNNFNIPWPNTGPGQFASGDFDGDGHTEIVGGSDYGVLTIFESVESDSFVMVWQGDLGHPNAYMNRFIGDTDHDGFGEWVSGSHDFSHGGFFFKVFEGNGDNQYHEIYYDSLPGNPSLLGGVDAGDVDGDGLPEFVFSSNSNVGLFKCDPISGWYRAWLIDSLHGSVLPYLVDSNADGLDEIVISGNWIQAYTKFFKLVQTSINDSSITYASKIRIFPNPANNAIEISYKSQIGQAVVLSIFDVRGREIFTKEIREWSGNARWALANNNGREVSSGLYFVEFKTNHMREIVKFTILK